jgi:transposase-like protein
MIRHFAELCKTVLKNISTETFLKSFNDKSADNFNNAEPCPNCKSTAKRTKHGRYTRGLGYLKDGVVAFMILAVNRCKCEICGKTHALLPDIVIPYGRSSLIFMLTVLVAYFERGKVTVADICIKYEIAISTLYEWKKRLNDHKELLLGLLQSQSTKDVSFLKSLLSSPKKAKHLRDFFRKHAFSFLQRCPSITSRSRSP